MNLPYRGDLFLDEFNILYIVEKRKRRQLGERMEGKWRERGVKTLTPEMIAEYLANTSRSCMKATLKNYERGLRRFYDWLPADKSLERDSLSNFQRDLIEKGYRPNSVNLLCSPVSGMLEYLGLWEEAQITPLPAGEEPQPELTRSEYLRLLSAAKALGKERTYLLVKVFATTGITVQELPRLTVEAAQAGKVVTYPNRVRQEVRISPCVGRELLEYAHSTGVASGPIFITRNGKTVNRGAVTALIQKLAGAARVSEEKCNPRCLRKLYLTTQDTLKQNVAVLLQMTYDRMLEQEQATYGWDEGVPSQCAV